MQNHESRIWRFGALIILLASVSILTPAVAQEPPRPGTSNIKGTSFLDHETPIANFTGKTFLRDNIPYIDIPDKTIQDVYYYRWSSLARHLHYTIAGAGFVLTEFLHPVFYGNIFSTINAANGHHIDEGRWLRGNFYTDDYLRFWFRGPGVSTAFTHWTQDSAYRKTQVDGNAASLASDLEGMLELWHEWDHVFDSRYGLYYYLPISDAQEFSLPGWVVSNGGLNNLTLTLLGPNTYRPSHNAYMVANAQAIAHTAQLAGNASLAKEYLAIARGIKNAMFFWLWDYDLHFFVDFVRKDNYSMGHDGRTQGRELVGLFPYRFGIGLTGPYANEPMKQLFDPEGFQAEYGPTTLERRNEFYDATKPSSYCCYWNGQSWPFSTSHVLKSVAAAYRTGKVTVTADQYYSLLSTYAKTQYDVEGNPFVAESHYPELNTWSAYQANHSEHYDHSTNNDDVITGLLGLVPRSDNLLQISPIIPVNWTYFALENVAYHGHLITYLYDRDGSRYNQGAGLSIFVDGQLLHHRKSSSALITLPGLPKDIATDISVTPVNIATNPLGPGHWPNASATTTFALDSIWKAIDGVVFYDYMPDNRWTNNQSFQFNDTYAITFARPRTFSSVTLAIYSDRAQGGVVDCPAHIEVHGSDGLLANVTDFGTKCLPNDRNTISFGKEVTSLSLSVNMFIKRGYAVGLAELEVWVPPNRGPVYYWVDGYLTNSVVVFDKMSTATTNGAVVGNNSAESTIMLPGVHSESGGGARLEISYTNRGAKAASLGLVINRFQAGNATLVPTEQRYGSVGLDVKLLPGDNYVTLSGGDKDVYFETMRVTEVAR